MDNQDNPNCPINPMPNPDFFSPYKESPYQNIPQGKDYKHLYQLSPYPSGIGLNYTPSKKMDLGCGCPSLGGTPLPINMNIQFSPLTNNNRAETSYQKTQGQQRGQVFINDLSPFKPFASPNPRISDKK